MQLVYIIAMPVIVCVLRPTAVIRINGYWLREREERERERRREEEGEGERERGRKRGGERERETEKVTDRQK